MIQLHRNSRSEVSLKSGGERTPGCEFKPDMFFELLRKCIDEGMVSPERRKGMDYGLECNSKFRN